MNVAKVMGMGTAEIQKPKKQTYRAMYKYSKAIKDDGAAKMFRKLDNQAKARLHGKKSADAQQRILDLSEEFADGTASINSKSAYFKEQVKNTFNYVKELVVSKYYSIKAKF